MEEGEPADDAAILAAAKRLDEMMVPIDSLADIEAIGGHDDPDPIEILVPGSNGRIGRLLVHYRLPHDLASVQETYITRLQAATRPTFDKSGNESFPDRHKPLLHLCQRLVVDPSPKWLKNESALEKLPPIVYADLERKLKLAAGVNADFFLDWQEASVPTRLLLKTTSSRQSSGSSPPRSEAGFQTPAPEQESPPESGSSGPAPGPSASATTSTSSP